MRSWLTLALMGAVVAALGAWVYFKPSARDAGTHALSRLKAADVKRMRIERFDSGKAAATIVLEREAGAWRMSAPLAARADAQQVERLLGIVDARSAARYPAAGLDRYGLVEPQAKVTLDEQVFAYGALNPVTREQYVLTGDAVYAVPVGRATAIPREAEALLARSLFAPGEIPVRFELPGFAMSLEDGTWKLAPAGDASADERNAWVDAWRQATAVRAARYDGRAPAARMKVGLKDGRSLELGILQREPELVLSRADERVEFYFLGGMAKRLLAPPGAAKAEKSP